SSDLDLRVIAELHDFSQEVCDSRSESCPIRERHSCGSQTKGRLAGYGHYPFAPPFPLSLAFPSAIKKALLRQEAPNLADVRFWCDRHRVVPLGSRRLRRLSVILPSNASSMRW